MILNAHFNGIRVLFTVYLKHALIDFMPVYHPLARTPTKRKISQDNTATARGALAPRGSPPPIGCLRIQSNKLFTKSVQSALRHPYWPSSSEVLSLLEGIDVCALMITTAVRRFQRVLPSDHYKKLFEAKMPSWQQKFGGPKIF